MLDTNRSKPTPHYIKVVCLAVGGLVRQRNMSISYFSPIIAE